MNRLRRYFRVNAGTPEEKQLFHVEFKAGRNDVVLDLQILQEEIDWKRAVRLNPPDFRAGYHYGLRLGLREEFAYSIFVSEIQLLASPNENVLIPIFL